MTGRKTIEALRAVGWEIDDHQVDDQIEKNNKKIEWYNKQSGQWSSLEMLSQLGIMVNWYAVGSKTIPLYVGLAIGVLSYAVIKLQENRVIAERAHMRAIEKLSLPLYFLKQIKLGTEKQITDLKSANPESRPQVVQRVNQQWEEMKSLINSLAKSISPSDTKILKECRTHVLTHIGHVVVDNTPGAIQTCFEKVLGEQQSLSSLIDKYQKMQVEACRFFHFSS